MIEYSQGIPSKSIWSYLLLLFPVICIIPPIKFFLFHFSLKKCINCSIEPGFRFFYGTNILAKDVSFSNVFLLDYEKISIGEGSGFSKDCMIITAQHDLLNRNTIIAKPVSIGKNVWIASRTIILPGVTLGDNCVVGAGSVVTKSFPKNVVIAGNPAKVIKKLSI